MDRKVTNSVCFRFELEATSDTKTRAGKCPGQTILYTGVHGVGCKKVSRTKRTFHVGFKYSGLKLIFSVVAKSQSTDIFHN